MSTAELAASYAALILADDGIDITVRSGPYLPIPCQPSARPSAKRDHD